MRTYLYLPNEIVDIPLTLQLFTRKGSEYLVKDKLEINIEFPQKSPLLSAGNVLCLDLDVAYPFSL